MSTGGKNRVPMRSKSSQEVRIWTHQLCWINFFYFLLPCCGCCCCFFCWGQALSHQSARRWGRSQSMDFSFWAHHVDWSQESGEIWGDPGRSGKWSCSCCRNVLTRVKQSVQQAWKIDLARAAILHNTMFWPDHRMQCLVSRLLPMYFYHHLPSLHLFAWGTWPESDEPRSLKHLEVFANGYSWDIFT